MYAQRIIPCLDIKDRRVVKGINFIDLKDAGDPVECAVAYEAAGADEIVFLDITATSDDRKTVAELVRVVASKVFIPITVGGGIRTADDIRTILRAGADKVSLNSAAVKRPASLPRARRTSAASASSQRSMQKEKVTETGRSIPPEDVLQQGLMP